MLIRFSVENYMSFKEQQIFSMAAGKGSRHPSHIVSMNGNRLLKSSFIFGANAAGKSNFIRAIDFMRHIVISGDSKIGRSRDRYFRIDPACSEKPGVFQIELATNNGLYSYGFSIDYKNREFEAEWLYDITNEKEICFFERDIEKNETKTDLKIPQNSKDEMRYEVYKTDISANRLLLSEIAKKDIDEDSVFAPLKTVYNWFLKIVVIYPYSHAREINNFFVNNSGDTTSLAKMLSGFDTGIESISSQKKTLEEALSFMPKEELEQIISIIENEIQEHEEIRASMNEGAKKSIGIDNRRFVLSMEDGELMAEELMMNHGNKQDLFDLFDESDGTQRLFDLIPAYEVVKNGRVVLIDEVDRSFHSKLTEEFVRRYFELTEGNACQMICTTHDLNLLTLNLLRKDEIWFAERDNEHSTRLYSLSEFKTRNDKNILNDYVQGRYGAIPCISEIDSEEA
mgnify:FL=1